MNLNIFVVPQVELEPKVTMPHPEPNWEVEMTEPQRKLKLKQRLLVRRRLPGSRLSGEMDKSFTVYSTSLTITVNTGRQLLVKSKRFQAYVIVNENKWIH